MIWGIADRGGPRSDCNVRPAPQPPAAAHQTPASAERGSPTLPWLCDIRRASCHPGDCDAEGGGSMTMGSWTGCRPWRILPDQVPRRPPTHIGTAKCPRQVAKGWFARSRSSAILVNSRDRGGWLGGLCGHRRSWRRGVTRRLRPFPRFVRMRAAVIRADCGMGPVIEGQG